MIAPRTSFHIGAGSSPIQRKGHAFHCAQSFCSHCRCVSFPRCVGEHGFTPTLSLGEEAALRPNMSPLRQMASSPGGGPARSGDLARAEWGLAGEPWLPPPGRSTVRCGLDPGRSLARRRGASRATLPALPTWRRSLRKARSARTRCFIVAVGSLHVSTPAAGVAAGTVRRQCTRTHVQRGDGRVRALLPGNGFHHSYCA